jgi:2-C-methyl-D-erythritol 2,4-cyclodiphosphate synthase
LPEKIRVGIGYDIHRLARGRKLFLGGVAIKHKYGLVGHSDADALLHAVSDAVLGALGLPDIGVHFPDTDPSLKGISSKMILGKVMGLARKARMKVINADCVVVAESPRITPYRARMIRSLSGLLGTKNVNVKATTNEGIGFIGKNGGIACICAVLLTRRKG